MLLKKDMTILFQGDSITDAGRSYDLEGPDLGQGYPYFVATELTAKYPEMGLRFYNRGISGNRVNDLLERWDRDCIALKPDLVSIMIGINNTWRRYDSNDPTSTEDFYDQYKELLTRTRKELPDAEILIIEPYLVHLDEDDPSSWRYRNNWREDIDPKIHAVRKLAREFDTTFMPLDSLLYAASTHVDPSTWTEDGVHPNAFGAAFIAQEWIKVVENTQNW